PSTCVGDLTEWIQCEYFTTQTINCLSKPTQEERDTCPCFKEFFDSISGCENEIRLCTQSSTDDGTFEDLKKQWHATCDSRVTFEVTTPPLTSLTAEFTPEACSSIATICLQGADSMSQCSESSSDTTFLSCACQPEITSLVSVCQYDGNVSCVSTAASSEGIYGYEACKAYAAVSTS
ncbi:hypothetical protein K458DRAFT_282344, partial [Lentithecium fluviatile CBS 122367]